MSQQSFNIFSPVSADVLLNVKYSPEDSLTGEGSKRTPRRKLMLDDSLQSPSTPTVDSAYSTSSESIFTFSFSDGNHSIERRHSLAAAGYSDKENIQSITTPCSSTKRPVSFSSFPLSNVSANNFPAKSLIKHISSPLERMTLASPNSAASSSDGYFSDVFDNISEGTSQSTSSTNSKDIVPQSFTNLFAAPITCYSEEKSPVSRRGSIKRSLLDNSFGEEDHKPQPKKTPPSHSSFSSYKIPPVSPPSSQTKPLMGVTLFRSQSLCVPPPDENAMFPDSPGDDGVEKIGDHSKPYLLPLTRGTVPDLKCITSDTVEELLRGDYETEYQIIDCRYPYEYQAGHVKGAVNIWDKDMLLTEFFKTTPTHSNDRKVIIFHCEFSSKRAPDMCRFMRKIDRERNGMDFPKLYYPELYLIEGGYKKFFQTHSHLCEPRVYKTMLDSQHKADLLHFSKRSKSWSGGHQNHQVNRRLRHRHSVHDVPH